MNNQFICSISKAASIITLINDSSNSSDDVSSNSSSDISSDDNEGI